MSTLWIFCGLFPMAILAGCANVPVNGYLADGRFCFRIDKKVVCTADAVPSVAAENKAKQFNPVSDRQVVWLVRHARFDAYGRIAVSVNGQHIDMLPYTVSRFMLPPGPVNMVARYKSREPSVLSISGKAGEQAYVEVFADVGLFDTDFSLRQISETDGRRNTLAAKLIRDVTAQQVGDDR